jgi:cytochrome c peroxidase
MAKTQLNRELKDEEVASMVAFLESLTGEFPELKVPRLPVLKNRSFHVLNETAPAVK